MRPPVAPHDVGTATAHGHGAGRAVVADLVLPPIPEPLLHPRWARQERFPRLDFLTAGLSTKLSQGLCLEIGPKDVSSTR